MGGCCLPEGDDDIVVDTVIESRKTAAKVVIVGAGPAGIHMASVLIKSGWSRDNITILEKSDRISGKSYSVNDKGLGPNDDYGLVHEMGTCYNHPDYKAIFALFKEYDADNELKGIPTRGVFGTDLNEEQVDHAEQKHVDFGDWLLANSERNAVPKAFHWINDKITGGLAFIDAVRRYCNIWEEIFGKQIRPERYGMPEKPKSEEAAKRLNCTFLQFIQNEGVEALIPFFVYSQTVQGYGVLDKIPAYYGLYWNNPELIKAPVWGKITNEPGVIVVKKGFQHLWRQIAAKHELNIIKNAQITSVNRYLDDPERKTQICYKIAKADDYQKHPDDPECELKEDGETVEIECDYLMLACGCDKALSFLTDATEQEKTIFGALQPNTFCTTIYEASTHPDDHHERVVELWPNIQWAADGHLGAMRNTIKCWLDHDQYDKLVGDGTITKDRMVTYQFEIRPPSKNRQEDHDYFTKKLVADLEKWGEKDIRIVFQKVWDYHAVWSVDDIAKGYPWIVRDEMQGKNKNTFYLGASVSFESVLNVVEYNNRISDQYLGNKPPKK